MKKVSELIQDLAAVIKEYGDVDVMMARDPEGNGYSPFDVMSIEWMDKNNDVYNADDIADGECPADVFQILCLWP